MPDNCPFVCSTLQTDSKTIALRRWNIRPLWHLSIQSLRDNFCHASIRRKPLAGRSVFCLKEKSIFQYVRSWHVKVTIWWTLTLVPGKHSADTIEMNDIGVIVLIDLLLRYFLNRRHCPFRLAELSFELSRRKTCSPQAKTRQCISYYCK